MTTTTTVQVTLVGPGLTLPTLPVRIDDRDASVDATPVATTFTGLPAGTWKIDVHISSSPTVGAGRSLLSTQTTGAGATSLAYAPTTAYHAFKDFEGGAGTVTVYIVVNLWNGATVAASGHAQFTSGAAAVARTDQTYALQIPWLFVVQNPVTINGGTVAAAAAWWNPILDAAADVLQPIAGHPERTVIRAGMHWAMWMPTGSGTTGTVDTNMQTYVDAIFSYASGLGLGFIIDMGMVTPAWARATPPWGTATIPMGATAGATTSYCQGSPFPDSINSWKNYVDSFVGRYSTRGLTHVQCGNEPNLQRTSSWQDTNANYATSHKAIYDQIQTTLAATPGSFAVKTGLPNVSVGDRTYMASMYANGLLGHYDAISWHPYSIQVAGGGTLVPATTWVLDRRIPVPDGYGTSQATYHQDTVGGGDAFLDYIQTTYDASARFWITETGLSNAVRPADGENRLAASGGPYHYRIDVPETRVPDQWRFTLRQAARLRRVDLVDIWGLYDFNPTQGRASTDWGLMRNDKSKRPSYAVVKQTIADLRAGTA